MILKKLLLLDLCGIIYIKDRNNIPRGRDERKKDRLKQLINLIESRKYIFSFLLALIERATDHTNQLTKDEMISYFKDTYQETVDLIGKDNIHEPIELLETMINTIMDKDCSRYKRAELSILASISLLNFFNDLNIFQNSSKEKLFHMASKVAEEGERLKLSRGYPTIIICIASIYGCIDARKILKIKKDGSSFNPSNRLADIMSFYRLAQAKYMISLKNSYFKNNPDAIIFRTEDDGLENMHSYLISKVINKVGQTNLIQTICTSPEKLFPDLYKKGVCVNNCEQKKLYEILNFKT